MSEKVRMLIEELGEELGLDGMKLDEHGAGLVTTVEDLDVGYVYSPEGESLTLYCQLGKLPMEDRENWCAILLKANFGWQQNRGATLSLTARDQVVLQKNIRADLADLASLSRDFSNFFSWAALASAAIRSEELPADEEEPVEISPQMFDPSKFA